MGVHVYSNEQLIKISGANSYTELTDAPNIVPQGQGVIISDSVTIDSKGNIESSKKDSSLNISNVNTTNLKAENILFGTNKDRNLEDELAQVTGAVNALEEQDKFLIQDNSKNTILKVDESGLTTTDVILSELDTLDGHKNVATAIETIDTKVGQGKVDDRISNAVAAIKGGAEKYPTLEALEGAVDDINERTSAITSSAEDSSLIIQDKNNFTILKVDEQGVTTTNAILSELGVYNGNVADAIEAIDTKVGKDSVKNQIDSAISAIKGNNLSDGYNTLEKIEGKIENLNTKTSGIDSQNEEMFIIQDNTENKNTILKVDNTGLTTTHIYLKDLQSEVSAAINANTTNISNNANAIQTNIANIGANTSQINQNTTNISENAKAIAANTTNIKNNADAINILNSGKTIEGSVDKKINDAMISIVDGAPETYNTFKEVYEYINTHQGEATSIMNNINDINTRTAGIDSQNEDIFIIQDNTEKKNTILKVDKDGLITTDVTLAELYNIDSSTEGKVSKSIQNLDTKITTVDSKVGTDSVANQINSAVDTLKNNASDGYDTLGDIENSVSTIKTNLETKISTDINSAITTLKNNASDGYDTLGDIEGKIENLNTKTSGIDSQNEEMFIIQDNQESIKNTILKVDNAGLTTTDVILAELYKIDNSTEGKVSKSVQNLDSKIIAVDDKVGTDSVETQINSAITTLKNGASIGSYDTLGDIENSVSTIKTNLETKIETDIDAAIDTLKNNASDGYDTLGDIEGSISTIKTNLETKIETDIDSAVGTLTGNVQEYDTLEKLESAINNTDNRTAGISSEAGDMFVIQDNQVQINTIAKIDSTGLITTDVTLSTLGIDNGSVSTAITSLHTKVGNDSVASQINSAISTFETNIINGADYSNLKEIQDDITTLSTEKVDSDYVERTISSAIDDIKGDVSDDYNTLEKIANKVENAFSKNIITCTKAEYESFGSSVQSDNKIYFIK